MLNYLFISGRQISIDNLKWGFFETGDMTLFNKMSDELPSYKNGKLI